MMASWLVSIGRWAGWSDAKLSTPCHEQKPNLQSRLVQLTNYASNLFNNLTVSNMFNIDNNVFNQEAGASSKQCIETNRP
jgi:hypothetical protein